MKKRDALFLFFFFFLKRLLPSNLRLLLLDLFFLSSPLFSLPRSPRGGAAHPRGALRRTEPRVITDLTS